MILLRLTEIAREAHSINRARRAMEKTMTITLQTKNGPIEVAPDTLVYLRYEACTARTLLPNETGRIWLDDKSIPVWKTIDGDIFKVQGDSTGEPK